MESDRQRSFTSTRQREEPGQDKILLIDGERDRSESEGGAFASDRGYGSGVLPSIFTPRSEPPKPKGKKKKKPRKKNSNKRHK